MPSVCAMRDLMRAKVARALVTEPDQGLTAIYSLIATAKKSIDMTMYELTDVTVMDTFAKAAKAGEFAGGFVGFEAAVAEKRLAGKGETI